MSITDSLKLSLARSQANRLAKIAPIDNSAVICQVTNYDINTSGYIGTAPDGSIRYFRYIGNAALAIGDQVSVVLPSQGVIGWADTKAR